MGVSVSHVSFDRRLTVITLVIRRLDSNSSAYTQSTSCPSATILRATLVSRLKNHAFGACCAIGTRHLDAAKPRNCPVQRQLLSVHLDEAVDCSPREVLSRSQTEAPVRQRMLALH